MKGLILFFLILNSALTLLSCQSEIYVEVVTNYPVITKNQVITNIVEGREAKFDLSYTSIEPGDIISCEVSDLNNIDIVEDCICDGENDCYIRMVSNGSYQETGSFDYKVTTTAGNSNISRISFTLEQSIPFVSIWRTTSSDETITLPLREDYRYNLIVDWGDSTSSVITSYDDVDIDHTYSVAGDYTVTISGLAEAWYFNFTGSRSNIIEVTNFGNLGWINLENAFSGCRFLESFLGGDTSQVTNVSYMFNWNDSLTDADLSSWDTKNVSNFKGFLYKATNLVNLDISSFKTGSATDLSRMFYENNSITSLDLSHFNTSKVEDFTLMFHDMSALNNLNISNWDTSSAISFSNMFNSVDSITSLDLSHFDTSKVENVSFMFANTTNLTTLNVNNWNLDSITNSTNIFSGNNAGLAITCDQISGTFFGETCI